tara:strand:- start:332 stop:523 length:192 start_codon:yes stop_codon:yes gene_type:complete
MESICGPILGHLNQPHMTLRFVLFLGLWLLLQILVIHFLAFFFAASLGALISAFLARLRLALI